MVLCLCCSNLTDVNPALEAMGVRRFAMLSSYPYPPQFLDWYGAGDFISKTYLDD